MSEATAIDQLTKLAQMKSTGILTDEEFAAMKAKLLNQDSATPAPAIPQPAPSNQKRQGVGFGQAINAGFDKYATFKGRAPRSELWFWVLFAMIVAIAAIVIDNMTGTVAPGGVLGPVYGIMALVLFLPGLSVSVRRLHDTDRSGWWYWIVFLPIIGSLILLVWFCSEGTNGENRFGPDPLLVH